jgi:hypothetical protein
VDPEPLPLDGETVSHEPFPDAFQPPPWQPLGNPLIVTSWEPAAELGLDDEGLIVKLVQAGGAMPDCVTENVRFAMVALSVRDDVNGF